MIKFDSARYLDDKIKKSNPTAQGGKRLRGLDMYTGPIKNELIGAGLFLREDRRQMMRTLYQKDKEEILQEFEEQKLSLYSQRRKIITDILGEQLCWKGTESKKSVRNLSTTKAIRSAALAIGLTEDQFIKDTRTYIFPVRKKSS